MNSDQVATMVEGYIREAQSRIKGVGEAEYMQPSGHKFETQSLTELCDYAREELLDVLNYTCFKLYRLDKLRAALAKLDPLLDLVDAEAAEPDPVEVMRAEDEGMTLLANIAGVCVQCEGHILFGDRVVHHDAEMYHYNCWTFEKE